MRAKKLHVLIAALALVPFGLSAEEQAAADAAAAPVAASQAPVPSEEGSSPAPAASSASQASLDIPVAKPSGEEAEAGTADLPPGSTPSWMGMDQPLPGASMAGARCGGGGRYAGAGYQSGASSDSDMPSPPPGYAARAVMPRGWQRGPTARYQGPWGYDGRGMADYGEPPADDWSRSDVQARAYPDMPGWGTGYRGMPKGMGGPGPMGQRQSQAPTTAVQGTDDARMLEVLMRIEARLGRIEALLGKLTW